MIKKLDYNTALKTLQNKSNIFVYWSSFNGEIRNINGEIKGSISTRIADKLLNSELLIHIGNGTDLLSHEKYYKLKQNMEKTLLERVNEESVCYLSAEHAAIDHLKMAHAHLFEETCGRDVDNWLSDIDKIIKKLEGRINS